MKEQRPQRNPLISTSVNKEIDRWIKRLAEQMAPMAEAEIVRRIVADARESSWTPLASMERQARSDGKPKPNDHERAIRVEMEVHIWFLAVTVRYNLPQADVLRRIIEDAHFDQWTPAKAVKKLEERRKR